MKKLLFGAVLAAAASGCVMVGKTNAAAPLTLDVQSPDMSFVDNSVQPAKKGVATASGILLFVDGVQALGALKVDVQRSNIDFMVGTDDMTVIGITHDGTEVTVMEHGDFVI